MVRRAAGLVLVIAFATNARAESEPASSEQAAYRAAAAYSQQAGGRSFVVMREGRVLFEAYAPGVNGATPHRLASGTKSFTCPLAAAAVQDGLLRLDEPVASTVPEWSADPRKRRITIRQLLSLTAGLDSQPGAPPTYAEALEAPAAFEPGARFRYGPASFQVFGEVLRRKLAPRDESVAQYIQRRVLQPAGVEAARWRTRAGGPDLPSGAFLTARDWAEYGEALRTSLADPKTPPTYRAVLQQCLVGSPANPSYGLGFWLNKADVVDLQGEPKNAAPEAAGAPQGRIFDLGMGDIFMAAGAGKQRLYVLPSLEMVMVRQGEDAATKFDDHLFLSRLLSWVPTAAHSRGGGPDSPATGAEIRQ